MPEASLEECLKLQSACFEIQHSQQEIVAKHIQINDHANFVLETIQNSEHQQILISNTIPNFLDMFVDMVGIQKYFPKTHRYGVDSRDQKLMTKKHCLSEFLKNQDNYEMIISIGDSPGDMALIDRDLFVKGVGYLYSHQTRLHRSAKCDYKINDLRFVLQELSANQY